MGDPREYETHFCFECSGIGTLDNGKECHVCDGSGEHEYTKAEWADIEASFKEE